MISALTDHQGIPDFDSENLVAAQLLSDDDDVTEDEAYLQHSLATLRELRAAEIADDSLSKNSKATTLAIKRSVTEALLRRNILLRRSCLMPVMVGKCYMVGCAGLG